MAQSLMLSQKRRADRASQDQVDKRRRGSETVDYLFMGLATLMRCEIEPTKIVAETVSETPEGAMPVFDILAVQWSGRCSSVVVV
jgi:hypothetical protein